MITNFDPATQNFLTDLNRIQLRTSTAQEQISSGLKVQVASDAPDQIGALLQLESQRASNTQTTTNLNLVQTETNAADNALTTAVQLLDKITQVAGQGLSSVTAQDRAGYATQIQDLQGQIVNLTSISVQGRYIFDGGDGSTAPYQANPLVAIGATRVSSTSATRQVADAEGNLFPYSLSAQDIFDHRDPSDHPAADNLLSAIGNAVTALNANDPAGLSTAIDSLHTASAYLGQQQTFLGTVENRVAASLNTAQSLDVSLQTQIGTIRNADLTQATLDLNSGNIQEQAALAAEGRKLTKTLFDYLA